MQFDALDYKIISEALYQLALIEQADIGDDDIKALSDEELENRLLCLRERIWRLQNKAVFSETPLSF